MTGRGGGCDRLYSGNGRELSLYSQKPRYTNSAVMHSLVPDPGSQQFADGLHHRYVVGMMSSICASYACIGGSNSKVRVSTVIGCTLEHASVSREALHHCGVWYRNPPIIRIPVCTHVCFSCIQLGLLPSISILYARIMTF